jgi:hypothetical protein
MKSRLASKNDSELIQGYEIEGWTERTGGKMYVCRAKQCVHTAIHLLRWRKSAKFGWLLCAQGISGQTHLACKVYAAVIGPSVAVTLAHWMRATWTGNSSSDSDWVTGIELNLLAKRTFANIVVTLPACVTAPRSSLLSQRLTFARGRGVVIALLYETDSKRSRCARLWNPSCTYGRPIPPHVP